MIEYQFSDNEENFSESRKSSGSRRPRTRTSMRGESESSVKGIQTPKQSRFKFHTLLNELSNLKSENLILKQCLAVKVPKGFRDYSKIARRVRMQTPNRQKPCSVCSKLLSKGFTTRFCPTHGFQFKTNFN
jgi:hypothetical protein